MKRPVPVSHTDCQWVLSDLRYFIGRAEGTEMLHADRPVSLNGGKQNVTKMSKGFRCCGPATGWTTEGSGIYSRQGQWIFICSKSARQAVGLNPSPVPRVPGVLAVGIKRSELGADHPSSCAVVKNGRSCILARRYDFVACTGYPLLGEGKNLILFQLFFGIGLDSRRGWICGSEAATLSSPA